MLPLVKVLGKDEVPMRLILAHALGGIAGKESARAMVNMILAEPEDEVRSSVLERLKERDEPGIVPQLVKALGSENIKVVNRAAWTLGNLDAVNAVPRLVGSLISTEERIVHGAAGRRRQGVNAPGLGPPVDGLQRQLDRLPDSAGRGPRCRRLRCGVGPLLQPGTAQRQ